MFIKILEFLISFFSIKKQAFPLYFTLFLSSRPAHIDPFAENALLILIREEYLEGLRVIFLAHLEISDVDCAVFVDQPTMSMHLTLLKTAFVHAIILPNKPTNTLRQLVVSGELADVLTLLRIQLIQLALNSSRDIIGSKKEVFIQ